MAALEGLGEALRRLRKRRGLSQPRAAEATGVDDGNLSRYETGAVAPALATLDQILDGYGADLGELAAVLRQVQGHSIDDGTSEGEIVPGLTRARLEEEVTGLLNRLGYGEGGKRESTATGDEPETANQRVRR